MPTSKTASCFWNLGIEVRGGGVSNVSMSSLSIPTPRVSEYQADHPGTFTAKYHLHKPVYVESFASMPDAIDRETQLKYHQPRF